jgi:4-oxalocrotonate tautomerase
MPHVSVKMYPGRSEQQKAKLADEITRVVMSVAACPESAVSVSIEDVAPDRWAEDVYKPDIEGNWDRVYKKPGYQP